MSVGALGGALRLLARCGGGWASEQHDAALVDEAADGGLLLGPVVQQRTGRVDAHLKAEWREGLSTRRRRRRQAAAAAGERAGGGGGRAAVRVGACTCILRSL